jgi:hypothetical protein
MKQVGSQKISPGPVSAHIAVQTATVVDSQKGAAMYSAPHSMILHATPQAVIAGRTVRAEMQRTSVPAPTSGVREVPSGTSSGSAGSPGELTVSDTLAVSVIPSPVPVTVIA